MPNKQQILSFLPWVRSFEAAARHMNFTEAARELGLSQAAVSQQIGLLEASLGEKLFERQRRGVQITPAGAAFLPHVQSAFGALTRSAGDLFGDRANQRVVIRSPISFASLWLAPRLTDLSRDLPLVNLDIKTVHQPSDYGDDQKDEGFDIRFGGGNFPGRNAHRLTRERLIPVAAPHVARQHGPTEIWGHLPLLGVMGPREMWAAWFDAAGLQIPGPTVHRFDSFITALGAARAGTGILLGSRPLIDDALDHGDLVPVSDVEFISENGHFVTYDSGMTLDYANQALLDWFKQAAD